MDSAAALIKQLHLAAHPEGGWYRETWRGAAAAEAVDAGQRGVRAGTLAAARVGAALGAAFIYGAGAIYLRWRGAEGMGFGDVKLMAMVGAFLGMKLTVFTIFAASVAGSIFGLTTVFIVWIKRTHRFMKRLANPQAARRRAWQSAQVVYRHYQMPFGVFLGSVALLAFFFGKAYIQPSAPLSSA